MVQTEVQTEAQTEAQTEVQTETQIEAQTKAHTKPRTELFLLNIKSLKLYKFIHSNLTGTAARLSLVCLPLLLQLQLQLGFSI